MTVEGTKSCRFCGEQINVNAVICRFCRMDLVTGESVKAPAERESPSPPEGPVKKKPKQHGLTLLLIVLGLGVLWRVFMPDESSNTSKPSASRTARIYSCDNPTIGGGRCFSPGDPKHMTVALRVKPGGEVVKRFKEDGEGVEAEILGEASGPIGNTWYRVRASQGTGYIAWDFVRESPRR